jgi:hypothetical protein
MSAFTHSVKGWLNAGLGLVYPEVCQLCGRARATPAEGYVCGGCRTHVRFIRQPFPKYNDKKKAPKYGKARGA